MTYTYKATFSDGGQRYAWEGEHKSIRTAKVKMRKEILWSHPNATNIKIFRASTYTRQSNPSRKRVTNRKSNPRGAKGKSTPWIPVKAIRFRDGKLDMKVSKTVKRSLVAGDRLGNPMGGTHPTKYPWAIYTQKGIEEQFSTKAEATKRAKVLNYYYNTTRFKVKKLALRGAHTGF